MSSRPISSLDSEDSLSAALRAVLISVSLSILLLHDSPSSDDDASTTPRGGLDNNLLAASLCLWQMYTRNLY